jgi:Fur family iron response transcriptional regulator
MAKTALARQTASAGQLNVTDAAERIAGCGIRVTDQRLQIASILLSAPQHLSAEQIAETLRRTGARVSKATIYNTLNLFAARGLIRQLSVDGNYAWFDSNVSPHYHFRDEQTGQISDVALSEVQFSRLPQTPPGTEMTGVDVIIRLRRRKEH